MLSKENNGEADLKKINKLIKMATFQHNIEVVYLRGKTGLIFIQTKLITDFQNLYTKTVNK